MPSMLIVVLTSLLTAAIYTDLRWSRIPNWLTFSAMGVGIAIQGWFGGVQGVGFSLQGVAVGMGLFLLPYVFKMIGAGDVKLMAAIGSILGSSGVLSVAALSALVGGGYALVAMSYHWGLVATSRKLTFVTCGALLTCGATGGRELQLPFKLRYGLAIAVGTLLFLGGVQPFRW